MFAALAQHLRTALVPLDVDAAHGTLLDGQVRVALRAGPAERAELMDASRLHLRLYLAAESEATLKGVDYFGLRRFGGA